MIISSIQEVIPESQVIVFAPHFDDFALSLGGYVFELKARRLLDSKKFHILLLFARSNYLARDGLANSDSSLPRLQQATGIRLLEDLGCLDELLGEHTYRYELFSERECFVRGKAMADSPLEFPHGMYPDFTPQDHQIFQRMQGRVLLWAGQPDTALLFPAAIKEHIDHFIVREAGLTIARQLGRAARASFYFIEDKPYAGIQTPAEAGRLEQFVAENPLETRLYPTHPQAVVDLVFKHYPSQVEEVYRQGVLQRARQLQKIYGVPEPLERLFVFQPG